MRRIGDGWRESVFPYGIKPYPIPTHQIPSPKKLPMNLQSSTIVFDFQNLEVYKKSLHFYIACKSISQNANLDRHVKDQLIRAAYSIVLNIAEGSGRKSPADRKNFFTISRASVFECAAILDVLKLEDLLDTEIHSKNLQLASEISKMLFVMVRNLTA
jgi:four helix bundle protein